MSTVQQHQPRIVILGGGFGGLYAARALRRADADVTLVDRCNHHLFQPLLYEVATAALSPADIASPIRKVLSRQRNTTVIMGEGIAIDRAARRVRLRDGEIAYDWLIVATGATHSYFGHDDWAPHAPGLKTIDDALEIRRRFLLAFEAAEREADQASRRAKLTFIVVGGGPTGVEMAGTMIELARRGIPRDFRRIDTKTARVILIEAADRLLPTYPPDLSHRARRDLERMGAEVRVRSAVTHIDHQGVNVGEERIEASNVMWAAGVTASPLARSLQTPLDRAGRVLVERDLTVPGDARVMVIGDLASLEDPASGEQVPGIAPAAMQMGRYAARRVLERLERPPGDSLTANPPPPFRYRDRGMLATIGRARAVGVICGVKVKGLLAWLLWALVHIMYLIGFRNRLIVMLQWSWAYLVFQRGARLITGDTKLELRRPRPEE